MEDDFAAFLSEIKDVRSEPSTEHTSAPADSSGSAVKRANDQAANGPAATSAPKKAKIAVSAKPLMKPSENGPSLSVSYSDTSHDFYGPIASSTASSAADRISQGENPILSALVSTAASTAQISSFNQTYPMYSSAPYTQQQYQHTIPITTFQPAGTTKSTTKPAVTRQEGEHKGKKKLVRVGVTTKDTYVDPTLDEWPENDFRLFCGDLGNEVTDEVLGAAFRNKYPTFAKARVVRDKYSGKSKGYGFVSITDPFQGLKALREMNLKYIGSRPVKLRKSDWKDRTLKEAVKKDKGKKQFLKKLGLS